ncbi:MAG: hypothetical protein LUH19_02625, partial [Lachnospiraceae bacterium]|nr:hypothetical protein [Lachnospiraceae bacterium]
MMRKLLGRSVKKSMGRFLAIMIITMLGAAFFGGLMATEPAFIKTAQHFTEEYNLYDFRILSTYGIDEEDVAKVAALEETQTAVGSVYYDAIVETSDGELIVRVHSITEGVNELMLVEGRMPESTDECVIDSQYFTGAEIGDVITFSDENEEDTLKTLPGSYTVVGKVFSPLYMNTERGTTSIGNGKLASFMYVLPESLDFEYYTEMYISLQGEWEIYSDEYNAYVDALESLFEETATVTVYARYNDIVTDAEEELLDGERDYADGEQELLDGEQELLDGEQELEEQKAEGEQELAKAWAEIEDGRAQIWPARQELLDAEEELAVAKAQYEEGLAEYKEGFAEYEEGLEQALAGYDELINGESSLSAGWSQLQSAAAQLNEAWAQLEEGKAELDALEEIYDLCVSVRSYLDENPDILDILEYLESSEDGTVDLDTLLDMITDEELREALQEAFGQLQEQNGAETNSQLAVSVDEIRSWLEENLGDELNEILDFDLDVDSALSELLELFESEESGADVDSLLAIIELIGTEGLLGTIDSIIEQYESGLSAYESGLASYYEGKAAYEQGLAEYYAGESQLKSGWTEYFAGMQLLEEAKAQLEEAWTQLEDARAQIEDGEQQIADGWQQLRDAIQELLDGETAYEDGVEEFNELIAEAEEKLKEARQELDDGWAELMEARQELDDGWAELNDLEEPEIYILGRDTLVGYVC